MWATELSKKPTAESGLRMAPNCSLALPATPTHPFAACPHHHHLLEVYASPTRLSAAGGGVIPFDCTIYFLTQLLAVPRLECIPLRFTSSALPPVLPWPALLVAAFASLEQLGAHSALHQSWPLRQLQLCSTRQSHRPALGPPNPPTYKRRNTTIRMGKAS